MKLVNSIVVVIDMASSKNTLNQFLIGLITGLIICSIIYYLVIDSERRTDISLAADYVESIVYGDVSGEHGFIKDILSTDDMTVGQVKVLYKRYGMVSRLLLENQIGVICNQKNISS